MHELTGEDFKNSVLNGRYCALIAFVADWDNKSEAAKMQLGRIQPKNNKLLTVGWIDVNKFPETVKETKLKSLPHFVLYREGKIMSEFGELYSPWDLKVFLGDELFNFLIKV
jgi:thioredoxin-like negative regulator of GroEL